MIVEAKFFQHLHPDADADVYIPHWQNGKDGFSKN